MFCLFRWETEKEKSPIYISNIRSYKGIRHDTDKNTWKHIRVWWIIRGYDIIVIWKAWMASGLWQCKYQSSHTERELLHCYPNRALDQPFEEFKALLSAATPCAPCLICVTLRTTSVTLSAFFTNSFHPIFDFPFWYLCSEQMLRIHLHTYSFGFLCCRIFSTKYKRMLLRFKRTEGYCSNSLSANHDNENW